jgi:hypothetical protein
MKSRATRRFRRAFEKHRLTFAAAREKRTPSLSEIPATPVSDFKRVHPSEPIYSVRVTRDYRALGILERGEMVWFWIGSHDDYGRLISRE